MSEKEDMKKELEEYRATEQIINDIKTWLFGVLCGASVVLGWFSPEIFG